MQDFAADYWKKTVDSINSSNPDTPVGLVALIYGKFVHFLRLTYEKRL
jgi:hypothetical protein